MTAPHAPLRRCALALLAVGTLAGCGHSGTYLVGEPPSSEQAALCQGSRAAIEQLAREHPEAPIADMRQGVEEACRRGFPRVPTPAPLPAISSPGCQAASDYPRIAPGRRSEARPARPVPFFARRSGALPPTGSATVGGVALPRGSRCGRYWTSDSAVADPIRVASRLAAAFPRTGLWPVLWNAWEDPDRYMFGAPLRNAPRMNVEAILRRVWIDYGLDERPFPGLAPSATGIEPGIAARDPFGTLARSAPRPESGWMLVLVPCNRPADVMRVLHMSTTEVMSDRALSAVLRSWEERFGAVPTAIGPGAVSLAVGSPPRTRDEALRLAAEHAAFAPESDDIGQPGYLEDLARQLRTGTPGPAVQSRHVWTFDWMD